MPGIADKFGRASLPTDVAVATTVKTTRAAGVSVLEAFDLSKFAIDTPVFFVTYKKTTDPVTGEVSITSLVSWKALVNPGANTLTNLTVQPGYVDGGNAVGDFIECIPTSAWENSLIDGIFVGHNPDGTFKKSQLEADLGGDAVNPVVRGAELFFDHVASGAVLAGLGYGTNLNVSLTSGVCYINGNRQIIPAVATRAYTSSKDTYVDALYNSSGTATLVYTEVANNAASPALAANSIRLGIVVTGATNITNAGSINQGQEDKVVPIASSMPYSVSDSLGNLICPRDPNRKILTIKQRRSAYSADTAEGIVGIPGFSTPVKVPEGRKIRVIFQAPNVKTNNASVGYATISLHEGAAVAGTQLTFASNETAVVSKGSQMQIEHTFTPSSSNPTISVGFRTAYTGTIWGAGSGSVSASCIQLTVELV